MALRKFTNTRRGLCIEKRSKRELRNTHSERTLGSASQPSQQRSFDAMRFEVNHHVWLNCLTNASKRGPDGPKGDPFPAWVRRVFVAHRDEMRTGQQRVLLYQGFSGVTRMFAQEHQMQLSMGPSVFQNTPCSRTA